MKIYARFFSIHLRSQMQYKASFFFMVLAQFLIAFTDFIGMGFLFSRIHAVENFTFPQILLCFSVVNMAFALAECFFRGFDRFSALLGNGEFDRILVRPRNTVFLVMASKIEFARLGKLVQGILVLFIALPASGVVWTADKIGVLLLMLLGGVAVFCGLFLVYGALSFFTTEGLECMNVLTYGGREFGQYPMKIYGEGALRFFTYVVPIALFQYYPLLYLLGREEGLINALSPLLCLLFLLPCWGLWRLGLRHYKSTGS